MGDNSPTINELARRAGELFRSVCERVGLPSHSPLEYAVASGLDVAITLFEESTGALFRGLTVESALEVVRYFREEAVRSAAIDVQIAIDYLSWADVLAAEYLRGQETHIAPAAGRSHGITLSPEAISRSPALAAAFSLRRHLEDARWRRGEQALQWLVSRGAPDHWAPHQLG